MGYKQVYLVRAGMGIILCVQLVDLRMLPANRSVFNVVVENRLLNNLFKESSAFLKCRRLANHFVPYLIEYTFSQILY